MVVLNADLAGRRKHCARAATSAPPEWRLLSYAPDPDNTVAIVLHMIRKSSFNDQ